jgi:hypothetical protein
MLNNYNKLYEELIEKFVKLHNANITCKQKMNYKNAKDLRLTFSDFQEHVDVLRREIFAIQKQYRDEVLKVRKKRREQQKENKNE